MCAQSTYSPAQPNDSHKERKVARLHLIPTANPPSPIHESFIQHYAKVDKCMRAKFLFGELFLPATHTHTHTHTLFCMAMKLTCL